MGSRENMNGLMARTGKQAEYIFKCITEKTMKQTRKNGAGRPRWLAALARLVELVVGIVFNNKQQQQSKNN